MNELPPIFRDQRKVDADQLKLLSVFHFIGAGLGLLGILFLGGHYAVFHAIFTHAQSWQGRNSTPPPPEMFVVMKFFYVAVGFCFLTSGVLNLISGFCLRARKHRTFSLVVAGIDCLHLPVGTILGVFTIVILARDSVRELYEAGSAPQPPAA